MDRSRQFRRVSTKHQETDKQIADLQAWDRDHQYNASEPYVIKASAFHNRHLPVLEQAVLDAEHGEYEVLVFWAADRFWRDESLSRALGYLERIHAAGARVEFVMDSHLNVRPETPAWVRNMMLSHALGMANAESKRKSERSLMDKAYHRQEGSADGKAPWGYKVEGEKNKKRFVPTDDGRKWIPLIFKWAIDGKSLVWIAEALTEERVKGTKAWYDQNVHRIIANPMYRGERRNGGGSLEVEALVTFATWQEANEALKRRLKRGRSATKHEPALLRPICAVCFGQKRPGCPDGISVMYRVRPKTEWYYYRCAGSGPRRTGCGARMVYTWALDAIVIQRYSSSPQLHRERTFIPGRDIAKELRVLNAEITTAAARGDYAKVAELSKEATDLAETKDVRPKWDLKETGLTIGQWFKSLSRADKRDYLADELIFAARLENGDVRAGKIIRTDDDGMAVEDWGVFDEEQLQPPKW